LENSDLSEHEKKIDKRSPFFREFQHFFSNLAVNDAFKKMLMKVPLIEMNTPPESLKLYQSL
jgi:hypothetical protein